MSRLVAVLALLAPALSAAATLENASEVGSVATVTLDGTTSNVGFGFQASADHSATRIALYVAGHNTTGGNQRTYEVGLRAPAVPGGGPGNTWLGGNTNTVPLTAVTVDAWNTYQLPTPVALTKGTDYFIVVRISNGGTRGSLDLRVTTPSVGRVPVSQELSPRSVYTRAGGAPAYALMADTEPVFAITCDDADPWADPSCAGALNLEANPYTQFVSAKIDGTHPASQSFYVVSQAFATSVEVPLATVTAGSLDWELWCGANRLSLGTLASTGAAGPNGSTWYAAPVANSLMQQGDLCRVRVLASSGATATWVGAGSTSVVDVCSPYARATFHGSNAHLEGQGTGGGVASDGLFRVQTCWLDCPDAGVPGLDASLPPGLDAAAPGLDAAAPGLDAASAGLDASVVPGLDASVLPGLDATVVVVDAALASDAALPGDDVGPVATDAELLADAQVVADDAAAAVDGNVEGLDAAIVAIDSGVAPEDSGSTVGLDAGSAVAADASAGSEYVSPYGCGCRSAGGLLPLGLMVWAMRPRRRDHPS